MLFNLCIIFLVFDISRRCEGFSASQSVNSMKRVQVKKSVAMMSSSPLNSILGIMPICLQATSKTTTTNDPTAGMSPEEIVNYISNVGGGMCGYPDWVRTAIGVGLNLSLIAFGIATVSYGESYILQLHCCLSVGTLTALTNQRICFHETP